jgi:hypothetical protein
MENVLYQVNAYVMPDGRVHSVTSVNQTLSVNTGRVSSPGTVTAKTRGEALIAIKVSWLNLF